MVNTRMILFVLSSWITHTRAFALSTLRPPLGRPGPQNSTGVRPPQGSSCANAKQRPSNVPKRDVDDDVVTAATPEGEGSAVPDDIAAEDSSTVPDDIVLSEAAPERGIGEAHSTASTCLPTELVAALRNAPPAPAGGTITSAAGQPRAVGRAITLPVGVLDAPPAGAPRLSLPCGPPAAFGEEQPKLLLLPRCHTWGGTPTKRNNTGNSTPPRRTIPNGPFRVSPAAALLALLRGSPSSSGPERGWQLTLEEKTVVSALLFEGDSAVVRATASEDGVLRGENVFGDYVERGRKVIENELARAVAAEAAASPAALRGPLSTIPASPPCSPSEAEHGKGPAAAASASPKARHPLVRVAGPTPPTGDAETTASQHGKSPLSNKNEDQIFVLEKDQVRKFFDTDFSLDYLYAFAFRRSPRPVKNGTNPSVFAEKNDDFDFLSLLQAFEEALHAEFRGEKRSYDGREVNDWAKEVDNRRNPQMSEYQEAKGLVGRKLDEYVDRELEECEETPVSMTGATASAPPTKGVTVLPRSLTGTEGVEPIPRVAEGMLSRLSSGWPFYVPGWSSSPWLEKKSDGGSSKANVLEQEAIAAKALKKREHLLSEKANTQKGITLLLSIAFVARDVHSGAALPLNDIYNYSGWFRPRARERRSSRGGRSDTTMVMGCVNKEASPSLHWVASTSLLSPRAALCQRDITPYMTRVPDTHRPMYEVERRFDGRSSFCTEDGVPFV